MSDHGSSGQIIADQVKSSQIMEKSSQSDHGKSITKSRRFGTSSNILLFRCKFRFLERKKSQKAGKIQLLRWPKVRNSCNKKIRPEFRRRYF